MYFGAHPSPRLVSTRAFHWPRFRPTPDSSNPTLRSQNVKMDKTNCNVIFNLNLHHLQLARSLAKSSAATAETSTLSSSSRVLSSRMPALLSVTNASNSWFQVVVNHACPTPYINWLFQIIPSSESLIWSEWFQWSNYFHSTIELTCVVYIHISSPTTTWHNTCWLGE